MSELFEIPVSESPRKKWQKRVCAELRIFTHHSETNNWMAFSQTEAIKLLTEYELTQKQKDDPMELFASYCRLLEEAGHIADRQATEFDAICEVCICHGVKLWNEENKTKS